MLPFKQPKSQYSEDEAAAQLGVSVEELRALIRRHIVNNDEEMSAGIATFQPADLLLLRILTTSGGTAAM